MRQAPSSSDTIVYIAGDWDLLHAGHIHTLSKARSFGSYLIVGVYSDEVSNYSENRQNGSGLPIMSLQERVLSVLGCKVSIAKVKEGADSGGY